METGALILLITFVIIAIIHFATLKLIGMPESKKRKFRKIYWYIYSIYFFGYGLYINLSEGFNIVGLLFMLLSIVVIILNALNKMEPKQAQS